jgi:hypothetical protein
MTSEILQRADELRSAASGCETRAQFRRKYPDWNMESINHAISVLDLKFRRDSAKPGPPKEAQACPKPTGKAKS